MTKIFVSIKTDHRPKPIPIRSFDWTAWYEGHEEEGCGNGKTQQEAIQQLRDTVGERLNFD